MNLVACVEKIDLNFLNKKYEINYSFWNNPGEQTPLNSSRRYQKELNDHLIKWNKYVKEGSIAIDIGCHSGDTSIPLGVLVGPNGKVLCFDPGPVFEIFTHNKNNNQFLNLEGYNFAITKEEKVYEFTYGFAMNNGGITVNPEDQGDKALWKGVNFISQFKDKINFKDISFIKIDAEGYDSEILISLKDLLREYKPTIQIEWFAKKENEIKSALSEINYQAFSPYTDMPIEITEENKIPDLICKPL
jgi:FkbM family methyltransferase